MYNVWLHRGCQGGRKISWLSTDQPDSEIPSLSSEKLYCSQLKYVADWEINEKTDREDSSGFPHPIIPIKQMDKCDKWIAVFENDRLTFAASAVTWRWRWRRHARREPVDLAADLVADVTRGWERAHHLPNDRSVDAMLDYPWIIRARPVAKDRSSWQSVDGDTRLRLETCFGCARADDFVGRLRHVHSQFRASACGWRL